MQFDQLKRREFITLLGGAVVASPTATGAQQDRPRRVGVLMSSAEQNFDQLPAIDRLRRRLEGLGWVDGRNLRIDIRWGEGRPEKLREYAKHLVEVSSDVIVGQGAITVMVLRQVTSTIPIVFWLTPDPVGQGLVASLARPGANITGFTNFEFSIAGKWLELLTEIEPSMARLGVLFNPESAPYAERFMQFLAENASAFHVNVEPIRAFDAAGIETGMKAFAQNSATRAGLLALPDALTVAHQGLIVGLATRLH